jgi:hypothetical protein
MTAHCSAGGEIPAEKFKHAEDAFNDLLDKLLKTTGNRSKDVTVAEEMKKILDGQGLSNEVCPFIETTTCCAACCVPLTPRCSGCPTAAAALHAHPASDSVTGFVLCSIVQEQQVVAAFTSDLYVAPLEKLSVRGTITNGFGGHHEIVLGGYSQV